MKRAIQSSSHNCPMEMRLPVFRSGRMWAFLALRDNLFENGSVASVVDFMVPPFAACTSGPCRVGFTFVHNLLNFGCK